jgi:transcription elongation factor/antiterminator RfaH
MDYYTPSTSIPSPDPSARWYAVWTKSRQEKSAAATLGSLGISHYLPLYSELRQWSDRKQAIQVPLFPGYLFVHVDLLSRNKRKVLMTPGVVKFVGNNSGPLAIPDRQIESVRSVMLSGAECSVHPAFMEGDRVRVKNGPLAGIEGTLVRFGSKAQLVLSIEMIQRCVAVTVCQSDVELVSAAADVN